MIAEVMRGGKSNCKVGTRWVRQLHICQTGETRLGKDFCCANNRIAGSSAWNAVQGILQNKLQNASLHFFLRSAI